MSHPYDMNSRSEQRLGKKQLRGPTPTACDTCAQDPKNKEQKTRKQLLTHGSGAALGLALPGWEISGSFGSEAACEVAGRLQEQFIIQGSVEAGGRVSHTGSCLFAMRSA